MTAVKITPKFQIVIPKAVRQSMGLKPGTRLHVSQYGDCIEMVRVRPTRWYRGFLKGIDTDVPRDEDRV